jgi:alkaline phosphatase
MKRSDFFRHGFIASLGATVLPLLPTDKPLRLNNPDRVMNIIFLVSDGMSLGTLTMADLLRQRKEARGSNWLNLYREGKARRAVMDMASLNSLVTDSAAASSSWGGGHRVNNGALNMGPNGEMYTPILKKFKQAGKAVGCVTSVPITHATPAGFSIATKARGDQSLIASLYLENYFDVMMGAGTEYFEAGRRSDKKDMFQAFEKSGYTVLRNKTQLNALKQFQKPIMGVFNEDSLPFAIDHAHTPDHVQNIPTLAEMSDWALRILSSKPNGFVLQIEGGKVDWAAHANDAAGLLYDQLAFDDALGVALAFAEQRDDTLIVVTSDHGNANPGLMGNDSKTNQNFEKLFSFQHSNDWILQELNQQSAIGDIQDRIEFATKIKITKSEAIKLKMALAGTYETIYEPMQDAPEVLGAILSRHHNIGFVGDDHTSDYTELAMVGPGSEELPSFIKNVDLHTYLLQVAGVKA